MDIFLSAIYQNFCEVSSQTYFRGFASEFDWFVLFQFVWKRVRKTKEVFAVCSKINEFNRGRLITYDALQ